MTDNKDTNTILMSDGKKLVAIPADTFDPKYATDEYVKQLSDKVEELTSWSQNEICKTADWIVDLHNRLAKLEYEFMSLKKE